VILLTGDAMPGKTLDIDDLLEIPDDSSFIVGVFNYCNRRCERCPFTARCRLYADERRDEALHPGDDWIRRTQRSLERAIALVKQCCRRDGVDFDRLTGDSDSPAVDQQLKLIDEMRQHPLQKVAEGYTFAAMKLARALRHSQAFNTWPADAHDALDTIEWYGIRVSSKINRALVGRARFEDEDPVQSDWNGSAKVARLEIRESRDAWETLLRAGGAAADSPLRGLVDRLDALDAAVAQQFPDAMAFVRPGFDERDVVATEELISPKCDAKKKPARAAPSRA
jgi:hypothetical protein